MVILNQITHQTVSIPNGWHRVPLENGDTMAFMRQRKP